MNSTTNSTTAPAEICDPYHTWPPENERAHDSLRPNIYASSVICWLIAAILVGLRLYTRGVIIRVLGPTDWSILAALVFSLATSVGTIEREYPMLFIQRYQMGILTLSRGYPRFRHPRLGHQLFGYSSGSGLVQGTFLSFFNRTKNDLDAATNISHNRPPGTL